MIVTSVEFNTSNDFIIDIISTTKITSFTDLRANIALSILEGANPNRWTLPHINSKAITYFSESLNILGKHYR